LPLYWKKYFVLKLQVFGQRLTDSVYDYYVPATKIGIKESYCPSVKLVRYSAMYVLTVEH